MKDGRYLDAIQLFRAEPSKLDQDWRAMWNLGWCHYNLKQYGEAKKCFESADVASPANPICKWARGLACIKKRKYREAEELLSESLQLKERFPTRIALALAYLAQGKVWEAERTHLDGIKLGTKLTERYESYAAFLFDVGRKAEAKKMNEAARERLAIQ